MSNPLVEQFRRFKPEATASLSDDQITQLLGDSHPDLMDADETFATDYRRLRPGDIGAETLAAAKTGVLDRLPRTAFGLAALGVDSTLRDIPELGQVVPALNDAGDFLRNQVRREEGEAAQRIADGGGRTVSRIEDVRGVRDALLYALPMFAENAPSIGVSLGAGALAGAASGGTGALPVIAAGLTSIGQNAGDMYADLGTREGVDRGAAIDAAMEGGVVSGLLDTAGLLLPASKLFPGFSRTALGEAVSKVAGRGGFAGALQGFVADGASEGLTEGLQELVQIAAEERATGKELSPDEIQSRVLNALAGGAIVGGPLGGLTGALPEGGGGAESPELRAESQGNNRMAGFPDATPAGVAAFMAQGPVVTNVPTDVGSVLDDQQPGGAESYELRAESPNNQSPAVVETATGAAAPTVDNSQTTPTPSAAGEASAVVEAVKSPEPGAESPAPRPFPLVSQFNAKGLPDRAKGDPRGRDDKFGIVLVKDGQAYGRRVFKTAGKVMVQDAVELLPRKSSKTANRSLADLEVAGYTVMQEPFQFAQAAPEFKVDAKPEDFDRWMGESVQRKQEVRNAIAQGAQQDVILKTLADADPDTAVALMAVQDVVAQASGGSFAHTVLGLTERVDTQATGERAGARATAKLEAAKTDPTKLLWRKNGRIFGLFDATEWDGVKELAAMGDTDGVTRLLESKLADRDATPAQAHAALLGWASGVAEEGKRKQAGDAAYRGKGSGTAKPVDTGLDTPQGGEGDGPTLNDTIADPSGDRTADIALDIPLTPKAREAIATERLALQGVALPKIDEIMEELGAGEELADVLAYDTEFLRAVGKLTPETRTQIEQDLISIYEARSSGEGNLRASAEAGGELDGDRAAAGGLREAQGGAEEKAQGLTTSQKAAVLPGLGQAAAITPSGITYEAKTPDTLAAVAFNIDQAVRASLANTPAKVAPVQAAVTVEGWARDNPTAPAVQVVNDASLTLRGHGIKGLYRNGQLVLNLAYLESQADVVAVLNHEWAHHTLDTTAGRDALAQLAAKEIPAAQLAAIRRKYPQAEGESAADYRLRVVDEWVAANAEKEIGTWDRIVEAVRGWLAKLGLVTLDAEEAARAMLRVLRAAGPADAVTGAERLSVTAEPIGSRENPANAVNVTVAAVNHAISTERTLAQALAPLGRTLDWFREAFGFADPNALKVQAANRIDPVTGGSIAGVNAQQAIGDFASEANASRARIMAYQAAEARKTALGKRLTEDSAELERLKNRATKRLKTFLDAHRNYLNADGLTTLVQRGVRELIARERRLTGRLGTQMGVVMQTLKQLDERSDELIDKDYAPVFAKLARNRDLTGRNLFTLLDTLTAQAGIDFKGQGVADIRRAIAEKFAANPDRAELGLLVQNTPESRALLATVTAYAKTNERVLLQIERRREKNTAERNRLQTALDQLVADQSITNMAVRDLKKTATLEERARLLYNQARQEARALERKIERTQQRITAAQAAVPVYQKALTELGRDMNLRPHTAFADGMTYHVPPKPDATAEEIRTAAKTLRLNSADTPTSRAELERDIETMTRFLQHREELARIDPGAIDGDYQIIKAQRDELLAGGWFNEDLRKVDNYSKALFLQPVGRIAQSFGTAAGRLVAQMFNREAAVAGELKAGGQRLGVAFERSRDKLIGVLQKGAAKDLTPDRFYALFYDPTASMLEKERGLLELGLSEEQVRNRIYQRVLNHLSENPATAPYVRGKEAEVSAALRAFMKTAEDASAFYNRYNEQAGVGVKDARLIVETLSGDTVEGIRDSLPQGVATFSRRMSRGLKLTFDAMAGLGWDNFAKVAGTAADTYATGGADAVRAEVAPYFDETVVNGFLAPLAETDTYSPFDAPALSANDLRPEADPARVAEAWANANGDVVTFAENLYDLHEGTGGKAAYVQATLQRLADYYGQIKESQDTAGNGVTVNSLRGMAPNLMIDARVLERWPTAWSEYVAFDTQTNHNLNARVAAQVAFGRDQERLAAAVDTMKSETRNQLVQYRTWERQAAEAGLTGKRALKAIEDRFVAAQGDVKGKAEFKRLRDMAEREPLLATMEQMILGYYGSKESDLGATRTASAAGSLLAFGMLNQPGTALMQLTEIFSPIIQGGVSAASMKQVLRSVKFLGEDLAGSFGQAIGVQMGQGSRLAQKYLELGYGDAGAVRRLRDALGDKGRRGDTDIGGGTQWLRRIPQALGTGVTRRGADSRYTVLRPLAPFQSTNIAVHRANTLGMWSRVEDMVLRGVDYFKAHPEHAADPAFELTAEALGLKGQEAAGWEKLRTRMAEGYDLPLARLAREAMRKIEAGNPANRNDLLSDRTRGLLHGLVMNEITLEGNLATMTPKAFTNTLARFILPLWGWPIRRGLQVAGLRMDEKGRATMAAVNQGLLALAVVSAGGLAFSVLVDEYNEKILRKARNLRSARTLAGLVADGQAKEAFMTFLEASNRVGTFGLLGEVGNTAFNVGQGGDNRGLSLDQRVVMMNSMLTLYRATGNLIAQGDADYSNVVRPLMSAVGGNGALQYLQLLNSAGAAAGTGPVFGAEEQFTRRINAQNYLRVGGRAQGLEVRTGMAGSSTPTPLTPLITRMALAAYANDRVQFTTAWREAIMKAREEGKEDPAEYVRDSFASRHPLRTVFRTLSDGDYRRLLARLPADGRADVEQAVRYYNSYAESLGASAYTGSKRASKK